MTALHLVAPPALGGARLDVVLVAWSAEVGADHPAAAFSRSRWRTLIDAGAVRVDGEPARASVKLHGGERVDIELPELEPLALTPEELPLTILHEDRDLIVLDKAAGMAVHPGAGRTHGTLVNALLHHCGDLSGIGGVLRPGIVHRLDKGTSGVMVVAKHDRAHLELARQFAERRVDKEYVAFVLGRPKADEARLETFFGRHPTARLRFTGRLTEGKRAITEYEVARSHGGLSELHVRLFTGRTHQIRVHLAELGHPIAGDALYGAQAQRVKDPVLRPMVAALARPALHAARLGFVHPTSGAALSFVAALPADLAGLAAALDEHSGPS